MIRFRGENQKYADQQHVFEQVGLEILTNAWEGYHCCLFAYGQTGAGKSYSMVGYGANKGIVPISCEEIFKRISSNTDKDKQYEVNLSMLQIYNEKVQDLLVPINKRLKQGYKIREHKTLGVYVEGLSKHYVDTYEAIEAKMEEGSKNRSIASTEMNASSSRAHTIIFIEFRQIEMIQGKKRQKLSVIYLVDLAGSQKVGKTGATGDRMKQANGINKSLSVLGLVISTLADKAMGKGKEMIVPYRSSSLTRILQNALGGNSKTLMICAISPASDNYQETLSTLRYADQAKKIQNKAVINESQTDKIIRNLTTEKEQLRQKVQKFQEMFKRLSIGFGIDAQKLQEFNDTKEQLRFNTQMMNDYAMSKTQKLQKEELFEQGNKFDLSKPHISNLNEDPQLSRKINYSIDVEISKIGKRSAEPKNDIEIGGMGIRSLHAEIRKNGEIYEVEPVFQNGDDSACYLNGDIIKEKTQLKHLDRLTFGTNNMFVVLIPQRQKHKDKEIDWEFAQNQLYLKKNLIQKEQNEERQRKIKEESEQILRHKEEELAELQRKVLEHEEMLKNISDQNVVEMQKKLREEQVFRKKRSAEAEKLKKQIQKDKKSIKDREYKNSETIREKYYFEKKLLKTLPHCIEINLIAKEFQRNISVAVKMLMNSQTQHSEDFQPKKHNIKIKVTNKQTGYVYWWDSEKLSNRYQLIKDMSEQYFQTGIIPQLQQNDDPFWDPPEPSMIGYSFATTKCLTYLFDNPTELSIIGEDDVCGQLSINMIPTDEIGEKNICEQIQEQDEFEPESLLGNPFYFNIIIEKGIVPMNFTDIFVEYSLKIDEFNSQIFKTGVVQEKTKTPYFKYKKLHSYSNINKQILQYLSTSKITFKIFGIETVPKQIPKDLKKSKALPVPTAAQDHSYALVQIKDEDEASSQPPKKTNIFQSSLNDPIMSCSAVTLQKLKNKEFSQLESPRAKKGAELRKKKDDCEIF